MSRYRTIHCLIWNDDKFPFLSDDARLVFLHLLTTPFSTPFGCYKASLEGLAAELRWPVARYRKTVLRLSEQGMVTVDEQAQIVDLPHALDYNKPANKFVITGWLAIAAELPVCELRKQCFQRLRIWADHFKVPVPDCAETVSRPSRVQEQVQEQEQEVPPLNNISPPTTVSKQSPSKGNNLLPDWLSPEDWKDFVAHRRMIKAPMTDRACQLAIAKLSRLRSGGHDPKAVIEQSIEAGWKGLFPMRSELSSPRHADQGLSARDLAERAKKLEEEGL